jgi:hypothetical protein
LAYIAYAKGRLMSFIHNPLIVRCLMIHQGEQWTAHSLEFGLATQAETEVEAGRKLESMVREYIYDAVEGEDRRYGEQLLARRAPASVFLMYYAALIIGRLRDMRAYRSPIPMVPAGYHAG